MVDRPVLRDSHNSRLLPSSSSVWGGLLTLVVTKLKQYCHNLKLTNKQETAENGKTLESDNTKETTEIILVCKFSL